MLPYIEVIDKDSLKAFALVEPLDCFFELSYYDVGEFSILCNATQSNLKALKKGQFVKIPNKRFIWVIDAVQYSFTAGGVRRIRATGYEAKYLLNFRSIETPRELQGTITSAVYKLVSDYLGSTASEDNIITGFSVDTTDLLIDISGTQATRGKLLEFVNTLLKSYNCGSQVVYENGALKYQIINGEIKPNVKFSQSLDNLLSSEYLTDDAEVATCAVVVSTIDNVDYTQVYDTGAKGIDRRVIIVSSNLSTKYEDANGVEKETTPTSDLYKGWQIEEGKNALANQKTKEEVSSSIDLANSKYAFDKDFFIGDMVKVQDEYFNYSLFPRILKYTIKQDAKAYGEEAEYGG